MVPGMAAMGGDRAAQLLRRGASRTKEQSREFLRKAMERAFAPRTVGVFEYEMHPAVRYGWGAPVHQGLLDLFVRHERDYEPSIDAIVSSEQELRKIPGKRLPSGELAWDNDWWSGIDSAMQYVALRDRRPANYIEVGSGFSTQFARRAITDHGLPTRITSIDPHPRAEIDALCDEVVRSPLEATDLSLFDALQPGDIVLIDCSHCAFMNSDVVVVFLDVLTKIPEGVLVGFDDIFLPWDYPPGWEGRWYGEQYVLASMLLGGADGWTVRFPAWYLTQESPNKDRFASLWDHMSPEAGNYAMSFWMERTAGRSQLAAS
jgi:hypothetical protein